MLTGANDKGQSVDEDDYDDVRLLMRATWSSCCRVDVTLDCPAFSSFCRCCCQSFPNSGEMHWCTGDAHRPLMRRRVRLFLAETVRKAKPVNIELCYCSSIRLWLLSSRCQSFFATLDLIRLIVRRISAMLANWQQSRSIYW